MGRITKTLGAAAAALAICAPAAAARAPHDFFGVVYDRDITSAPAAAQDAAFKTMHQTGVQTARVVFSWADAQPERDQPPSFALTDPVVARAAANRIDLLPIVIYAPFWARKETTDSASPPLDPAFYTDYLKALVARYGPAGSFWGDHPGLPKRPLRTWQIWNEPQLKYQWGDTKNWQAGYGRLLHASHDALKAADPGSTVVLAGATNYAWDALESLYDKGGIKGQFDVAAMHPYTGSAGRVLEAVKLFKAVLKKHGDAKRPLWITELAWPASKGRAKPPSGLKSIVTTRKGMAARLARAYRLLVKTHAVQRAYWYTWASGYHRADGIFDFTGLERWDGRRLTATPALRAYRKVAHSLS